MAHSLLLTGAILGCNVVICSPKGMSPDANIVKKAKELAAVSGGSANIIEDPR